ncbi:TetR family transcriptional regulator [Pantoea wallisii]|uniref:TetR family transcriptional regulator n=1 Tax=Pantoea wallisii TaxID=1076551 RepID=A0A1X1CY12_9GAMM|nr:TetR/AcrR family transcriptional regulator [Pantoea wallisii]ORM69343.1 TetR family transcriptional regulator [Pantoea wallisii]
MRDAEASRAKILEAATDEFATWGIAGARIERIARSAGCNKNLIYIYFENKERLFQTVMETHLTAVYDTLTFRPDDLPGYASDVFDFAQSNPRIMRLMAWFSLEQQATGISGRNASFVKKMATLQQAQAAGRVSDAFPPEFLLTTIMALSTAWSALGPFGVFCDNVPAGDIRKMLQQMIAGMIRS